MVLSNYKRPELNKPVHGGLDHRRASGSGVTGRKILDFSANINPLSPPAQVKKALAKLNLNAYPDRECQELRQALAENTGVPYEQIVPGNGSTELIHLLARAYLNREDKALIFTPTFSEYEMACRLVGAETIPIQAKEESGFRWDIHDAIEQIRQHKPGLVFLCNPNSPTGAYLPHDAVVALANTTKAGLFVIDEAYIAFVNGDWESTGLLKLGNVVILRSMTKDFGLAGLRLGYALCSEEVAETLFVFQPSWSVSSVAQVAGVAALSDKEHVARARACVNEAKAFLTGELRILGLEALPSETNFFLVKVKNAAALQASLMSRDIYIRDCSSFGLPEYIRIAVRTIPECRKLVKAMKEILGHG